MSARHTFLGKYLHGNTLLFVTKNATTVIIIMPHSLSPVLFIISNETGKISILYCDKSLAD